jgi:Protein of unknown function (DUF4242)
MPKYVIERTIPGASSLTADQLHAISARSVEVIDDLGTGVQWVHSYVTDDKIYCVYNAKDADIIREHAKCGGFPADVVARVATVIDPTTAEA